MAGYNPNDSEGKRTKKAAYFFKSMMQKGQPKDVAIQIASRYYHVKEEDVRSLIEGGDAYDDLVLLDGCHVVSASELFDPGDFH